MSQGMQVSTPPRSRITLLSVVLVVGWTVANIVATMAMAATQTTIKLSSSTMGTVIPVVVAITTALAYILVVRRSPSPLRWIWCAAMVTVMAMAVWASVQRPQTGQHTYGNDDVIRAWIVGTVIVGPLLWFYCRPSKVKAVRG